ncbi:MAG: glutamine--fructose-6-phosphate transaminase (isomerizing) [Nitrospiraceae bacterium]|nr:glutamine--fructose-6-phosphate transaminase (isomerizing) [Nitrospiraceae bacterium]
MCGIVGYIGQRSALPVLIDGLRRLEYRGYDSAGIAYANGEGIGIHKTMGRIDDLKNILPAPLPEARVGLGHTRWATHGAPSDRNAHPHETGGVAVVHNGIIENYQQLKARLIAEGHEFASDTATEVIPQLISSYMQKGFHFEEAMRMAILDLKGSYALGIMSASAPGKLFAVRNGSPLVVGFGPGEFFFASDIPAFLAYTKKFAFMEDGQIFTLAAGEEARLERLETNGNSGGNSGKRPPEPELKIVEIDWTAEMAEKEGYDYFMQKEIYEQPTTVMETMREWLDDPMEMLRTMGITPKMILGLRRLHIAACGTSYHAALVGKYAIEGLAHIPVEVEIASEFRYKHLLVEKNSLFVSITQSGETADTLAAQREAGKKGAHTLTICNVVGSTASREADSVLYTRAGPEIGVASTKAFTAQMAALCLLAVALGVKRGRLIADEAETLTGQLKKMPLLIEKALAAGPHVKEVAASVTGARSMLYLGRGINYPIALEGALKLKEISYIHAEGYPAGEMKHGPIALIESGLPVVVVIPMGSLFEKTLSNIEEVKARGGKVIAVTDEPASLQGKADETIPVPSTHPVLSPFVNVIPLQMLAFHTGVIRGNDVDKPRNLAKSVTVE